LKTRQQAPLAGEAAIAATSPTAKGVPCCQPPNRSKENPFRRSRSRRDCPFCARAKAALSEPQLRYTDISQDQKINTGVLAGA
jgi:transposase-like protein